HLDGAFERLGAGIAEEDRVGEGVGDQPLGKPLLPGDVEEVGGVPHLLDLLGQRRDEMRVRMAEHGDGDAGGEIEVFAAVGGEEIGALAPFKGEIVPSISRQYGWDHGNSPAQYGRARKGCGKADETAPTVVVAPARLPATPSSCGRTGHHRAPFPGSIIAARAPTSGGRNAESAGV